VANAYLEGTYSEVYPNIGEDEEGMKRLFTQFSFPGGIPSHVAPETPGSIHEGGELGYAVSHAYGAAFDNPISSSPASWETEKRRRARWPPPGTPTSF
jgi:xylulose-5-phosphate/fructose-6-phosphate phosphoketolase